MKGYDHWVWVRGWDKIDDKIFISSDLTLKSRFTLPIWKLDKDLFDFYVAKILCDDEVDTMKLAKDTWGFVGADIDNIVREILCLYSMVRNLLNKQKWSEKKKIS